MLDRLLYRWLPAVMMALAICTLLPTTSRTILHFVGNLWYHYR